MHTQYFTISNLKRAKTCKSRRVFVSSKTVCSGISKFLLQFQCFFRILCNIRCTFHFYWSHLKADTVHSSNSSLFRKRSIIGQLNVPAGTAENQEHYTMSKTIYIGFQNSYSFLEVFFDKQLFLKNRQINWKILIKHSYKHFQRILLGFVIFQNFLTF